MAAKPLVDEAGANVSVPARSTPNRHGMRRRWRLKYTGLPV